MRCVQVTLATPTPWARRVTALGTGAALAGSAAVVALNDPSAPGSRFPACPFHATTGLWCPGCGLTRGVHQLLNGHPLAAISYNVFVPVVVVAVVAAWWGYVRTAWGRPGLALPVRWQAWLSRAMPVVLVAYAVLRNIPAAPFRALAP